MSKPQPRELMVESTQRITPNMQRVVLTGESLADFPADSKSGYVKLQFAADGAPLTLATQEEGVKPTMRSYTVREIDVAARKLTLDMMLHGHSESAGAANSGPAGQWAEVAKTGDRILVGGPGPTKLIPQPADYYLLVGDMTALPAIAGNLELLPADAKGVAIIEVVSADDVQTIDCPEGVHIEWVIADDLAPAADHQARADASLLVQTALNVAWPAGKVAVWAACEFHKMRALRRYFRNEKGLSGDEMYISSYWMLDRTDEQHKQSKKTDAEA